MKTLAEVEARLAELSGITDDEEAAHSTEDEIHIAVLRAIADGSAENPQALAKAALKTLDLDFARWCA